MSISRRGFLHGTAAGLGALAVTSSLGRWAGRAQAAGLSRYDGYRAGVCVFLLGGNDGNQLAVPTADVPYGHYASRRRTLAIPRGDLARINPIDHPEGAYGLHPALVKLRDAFNGGTAALVWNVGPVAVPTRQADLANAAHPRPYDLRSHSSQQDAWSSAVPRPAVVAPSLARSGWGGRLADRLTPLNRALSPGNPYPAMTLLGGRRLYAAGDSMPLVTSIRGEVGFKAGAAPYYDLRREAALEVAGISSGVELEEAYGEVYATAAASAEAHNRAREMVWSTGLPAATTAAIAALFRAPADKPHWNLHTQLEAVLRDIAAAAHPGSDGLGLRRQMFSVGVGSFDTHDDQAAAQGDLFAQLDFALHAFTEGLRLLGASGRFGPRPPQATLFTMSDFGRTLQENANRGTDHGWGNHMIVVGAQVDGRRVFGRFPDLAPTSTDSADGAGRWIPSLSVDQYARGIAAWLGASAADLAAIFPNHASYVADAVARNLPGWFRQNQVAVMRAD